MLSLLLAAVVSADDEVNTIDFLFVPGSFAFKPYLRQIRNTSSALCSIAKCNIFRNAAGIVTLFVVVVAVVGFDLI